MRHRFEAFWPVVRLEDGMHSLIAQAKEDLPLLLERAHCRIVGRCRWAIRPASDVPGTGGQGLVLTVQAAAEPVPRLLVEDCKDDPFLRRLREAKRNPPPGEGEGSAAAV